MGRRVHDGGAGRHGRLVLFPDRERLHALHHGHQRLAHRLLLAALRHLPAGCALSLRALRPSPAGGLGPRLRRHGAGGAQRAVSAPALAAGRLAGLLLLPELGGLLVAGEARRRSLHVALRHPQGVLLWRADHPAALRHVLHGLPRSVYAAQLEGDGQPALPGLRGLHALLPGLEPLHGAPRGGELHQLVLPESGDYHRLRLGHPRRADHALLPGGGGADPRRSLRDGHRAAGGLSVRCRAARGVRGKVDLEQGAPVQRRADGYAPAVFLDDGLREGQADVVPPDAVGVAGAVEGREDVRQLVGGDADGAVQHQLVVGDAFARLDGGDYDLFVVRRGCWLLRIAGSGLASRQQGAQGDGRRGHPVGSHMLSLVHLFSLRFFLLFDF